MPRKHMTVGYDSGQLMTHKQQPFLMDAGWAFLV